MPGWKFRSTGRSARPLPPDIAATYLRFAATEADGRSPLYAAFARAVAGDAAVLDFLAALPPARRQPNLLLAAVRLLHGVMPDAAAFLSAVLAAPETLRAEMLSRTTQTNEPGRCAVLLPVLAALPQPLALIEVGASVGLCLLPDRYGYAYTRPDGTIHALPGAPMFPCAAGDNVPLPNGAPRVVWRAGLDLNPLDVSDPDQAEWLRLLVWPEQYGRRERLDAALEIAMADPPRLVQGDLTGDALEQLCRAAPAGATRVIFHTAVLSYVPDQPARDAFARRAMALADMWIANEAPGVFPEIAALAGPPPAPGRFLLSRDGRPVAWTDPHGAAIDWI